MTELKVCPDCGGELQYYHGHGLTRTVCKNKCNGWKVLKFIDHNKQEKSND